MPGTESTAATSADLPNSGLLRTCREAAVKTREELDQLLSSQIPGYTSEDTSLVVFGSLARGEWTSGSDLDWTYLIDGGANSDHLLIAQRIQRLLEENKAKFRPPSPTGTFGNMAFSHDIIHQIGGQNDTNRNTTQRVLKLKLINHIRDYVRLTPLEILARSMEQYEIPQSIAKELFGSYRDFLEILDDEKSRTALDDLRSEDSRTDPTFQRIRKISEVFDRALDHIFFENRQIAPLTRKYGVF